MSGTWTLYSGPRFLFIGISSSKHPIWFSESNLSTLPSSPSSKHFWLTAPSYHTLTFSTQIFFHQCLQWEKLRSWVGNILVRTRSRRCGTSRQSACPNVSENLLTHLLRKKLPSKRNPHNSKNLLNPRLSCRKPINLPLILLTFRILNLIVVEIWWPEKPWL